MSQRARSNARSIVRRAAKAAVAKALCAAGAPWVVRAWGRRRAGGGRVLIVSYHRLTADFAGDARESLPSLLISADTLKRQIEDMAREREVVSLAEALRILCEAPRRANGAGTRRDVVAITIDDGYRATCEVGIPILAPMKIPATVFVATGYVGTERRLPHDRIYCALAELKRWGLGLEQAGLSPRWQVLLEPHAGLDPKPALSRLIARLPHHGLEGLAAALERRLGTDERELPPGTRLMDWDQVRACAAAGIDIGGHTVSHAVLSNLSRDRAWAEIDGCAQHIERNAGIRPLHFAYPNGYHTPAVRRMVSAAGFEAAVTTEDRENRRGGDPYQLCRKVLWENSTLGAAGYSRSLAACNIGGVFGALRLQRPVPGERPDVAASGEEPSEPERAAR